MAKKARPIPEGFHTVTTHLLVDDASRAIDFYKRAFGAEEVLRVPRPDGKIMHAELRIGDTLVMLSDEHPQAGCKAPRSLGGSSASLMIYAGDVDKAFQRALDAGAKVRMPVADMFWGDRYGSLEDPFGHQWALATHVEDVSREEMIERGRKAFSK